MLPNFITVFDLQTGPINIPPLLTRIQINTKKQQENNICITDWQNYRHKIIEKRFDLYNIINNAIISNKFTDESNVQCGTDIIVYGFLLHATMGNEMKKMSLDFYIENFVSKMLYKKFQFIQFEYHPPNTVIVQMKSNNDLQKYDLKYKLTFIIIKPELLFENVIKQIHFDIEFKRI